MQKTKNATVVKQIRSDILQQNFTKYLTAIFPTIFNNICQYFDAMLVFLTAPTCRPRGHAKTKAAAAVKTLTAATAGQGVLETAGELSGKQTELRSSPFRLKPLPALVGNKRVHRGVGDVLVITYQETALLLLPATVLEGSPQKRRSSMAFWSRPSWAVAGRSSTVFWHRPTWTVAGRAAHLIMSHHFISLVNHNFFKAKELYVHSSLESPLTLTRLSPRSQIQHNKFVK